MAKDDTREYSPNSLQRMHDRGETETRADAPMQPIDPDFWDTAQLVMLSSAKTSVTCSTATDKETAPGQLGD